MNNKTIANSIKQDLQLIFNLLYINVEIVRENDVLFVFHCELNDFKCVKRLFKRFEVDDLALEVFALEVAKDYAIHQLKYKQQTKETRRG